MIIHWLVELLLKLLSLCFIMGHKKAGKPGYGPYPTHYNPIVSRNGIRDFCNDGGNDIVLDAEYGDTYFRPGRGLRKALIHIIKRVVNILSFGCLSDKHTNILYTLLPCSVSNLSVQLRTCDVREWT